MSEVELPGAFVDEKSCFDFNNSFDTDDPSLLHEDFEDNYISSIQEITNFMDSTTCNSDEDVTRQQGAEEKAIPLKGEVRLLTKANEGDKDKAGNQRKSKYYAPLYVVRERVGGTPNQPLPIEPKKREAKSSTGTKEKRIHKDPTTKTRDRLPRQSPKKEDEPIIEIKKKDREEVKESVEQQRLLEEMRRAHEQEQSERENRLREKEKERQDRDKLQSSRIPGERATLYDLMTVQFNISATFEPGEVVLAPRTRGGYSYGRVVQHFLFERCYADSSVSHTSYHWRVVYPGPGGGNMFKDLPPAYIGKLVTAFNKDLPMPKDGEDGDKPLGKDLNNAVFSPTNKFNPNQIVLVPRSKGGFTYGRIVKECTFTCRLDDAIKHEVAAWRVLVSGSADDAAQKVRKDVLAGNIGKLYIPEQLQAAMQAATEAAALPLPTDNHKANSSARRRISPEARDLFPAPVLPTLSSTPYLPPLNYAQALGGGILSLAPTVATSSTAVSPNSLSTPATPHLPFQEPDQNSEGLESASGSGRVSCYVSSRTEADSNPAVGKRGVLELPEGVFAKAQRDAHKPRFNRSNAHENSNENLSVQTPVKETKPLIVIDGPNVAMKHGNKKFSVKGISLAVGYYKSRGFDVVAFVPEYFATRKAPQHQLGSSTLKLGDFMNSVATDDMPLLNSLVDQGLVVLTPPQDYDDSYSIEYARKHNCCIVTNDRYNDNIDKQTTEREKSQTRKFIRDHSISFTYIRDEFMPNPDFKFPHT